MTATATDEARISALIVKTLVELDEQGVVELGGVKVNGDTELFGSEGLLDSVGLVALVVAVEQELEDELGLQVGLADERAMSQRHSPYRTVSTLAAYAAGAASAG